MYEQLNITWAAPEDTSNLQGMAIEISENSYEGKTYEITDS